MISVITICYNEVANIKETLDSIVGQTYHDLELIVVDGGSTDGTKDIIASYEEHIAWWCSEPDNGIYNAMNKGVTHATGEYVIFMNGGDCFHDHKVLERVAEVAEADILEGHTVKKGTELRRDLSYDDMAKKLLADGICHQSAFIRTSLLRTHPYNERYRIAADWRFWLQTLLCEGEGVSHQYLGFIVSAIDVNGLTFSNMKQNMQERRAILQELLPTTSLSGLTKVLTEYHDMMHDPVIDYALFLSSNSPTGYNIVRKIAKRVVKLVKCFRTNP